MKFLWFWFISTGIVIILQLIYLKGVLNELKRKYPERYHPQYMSLCEWLSQEMPMFIPVLNILFFLAMILGREKIVSKYEKQFESEKQNEK